MLRLDKFLSMTAVATRTETAKAVRMGRITVNGVRAAKADMKIDPDRDAVVFDGEAVEYRENTYIMLNKPAGYVSATDDPREVTVLELLPDKYKKMGLFPCGRLDKNTLGLLILTNNGQLAHRLLSPKKHCEKSYRFATRDEVTNADIAALEQGVTLEDGYETKPCRVEMSGEREGVIVLTEGKYHQIKRMFEARGNKIAYLERIDFAGIPLDPSLERGQWRYLTEEEEKLLESHT